MKIENSLAQSFVTGTRQEKMLDSRMVKPSQKEDLVSISLPKSKIDGVGDVRKERVEAVKDRIASGFYDQPDVREAIATAFLMVQVA